MTLDEDMTFEFDIVYRGGQTVLKVFIFIDDIDLAAIAFYALPELANQIQQAMVDFHEG
jgi:hypothetical protein